MRKRYTIHPPRFRNLDPPEQAFYWWIADVIERIAVLYCREDRGNYHHRRNYWPIRHDFAARASETARDLRLDIARIEWVINKRSRTYRVYQDFFGCKQVEADMDLWEWAYFRLEWLEECYMACEWRLWSLLYNGMCPISEPNQIKIARLKF